MISRREQAGHTQSLAYVLEERGRKLRPIVAQEHFGGPYTTTQLLTKAFAIVLTDVLEGGIVLTIFGNRSVITIVNQFSRLVVSS